MINAWEVYITCPECHRVNTHFDFHENESSDRIEFFLVLNNRDDYVCSFCSKKHSAERIFTAKYCQVENLEQYKELFWDYLQNAEEDGIVCFSDFIPDCTEEPALSRLIAMYPDDTELLKIHYAYHLLHTSGLCESISYANLVMKPRNKVNNVPSPPEQCVKTNHNCYRCQTWINSKQEHLERHWCSFTRNYVSGNQNADSCSRYIDSTTPIHRELQYNNVTPSPIAIKSLPDRLFCQVPSNQLPFIHKMGVLLYARGDGIESQFSHIEYYPRYAHPLTPVLYTHRPFPIHGYSTLMVKPKSSIELLSKNIPIGADWFPVIFDISQIEKFSHFTSEDPDTVLFYTGADNGIILHEDILFHNPQILTPFILKNPKDTVGPQNDGLGNWDDITHLILKEGVRLNDRSFRNCKNLETLTIHCELRSIGCDSFCNCPKLRSVRIMHPKTNMYNGCERSFQNCPNLKEIVYADGSIETFFHLI